MQNIVFLLFISFTFAATSSIADDWSQWRGPTRNGIIESEIKFTDLTQFDFKWKAEVGIGFSSMAIADGLLVTLGHSQEKDQILCLNAFTGEEVWKQSYDAALDPNLFEGGPTSTPAIHDGKVFTISRQGLVHCVLLKTGEIVWKFDILKKLKFNAPTWGFSGSPLVVNEKVFFNAGRYGLCLHTQTGEVLWKSTNDVDAGYSSPVLVSNDSNPILVLLNAKEVNAVNALNGKLMWTERWITRYGINAADPIILNNHQLLVSSGYGKGTGLIEFFGMESDLVWRNRDVRTQMSPGVIVDGAVYAIDGDSDEAPSLVCFDPETGDSNWKIDDFGAGTLLAIREKILVLKENGELVVLKANRDKPELIQTSTVGSGKYWTPPALVNDRCYLRNSSGVLTCLHVQ